MELLPSVPQESIQHIRSGKDFIDEQCKVIIISYDLLAKHIDKILEKKFGVLICVSLLMISIDNNNLAIRNLIKANFLIL